MIRGRITAEIKLPHNFLIFPANTHRGNIFIRNRRARTVKNAHKKAFRFNYFNMYLSFLVVPVTLDMAFVWRYSRSDRRATKHILRTYEARPNESICYLNLKQLIYIYKILVHIQVTLPRLHWQADR